MSFKFFVTQQFSDNVINLIPPEGRFLMTWCRGTVRRHFPAAFIRSVNLNHLFNHASDLE